MIGRGLSGFCGKAHLYLGREWCARLVFLIIVLMLNGIILTAPGINVKNMVIYAVFVLSAQDCILKSMTDISMP